MKLQPAIPVLRIFDVDLARAFYIDWLGFQLDWSHQYDPTFPHYLQISRGELVLHLSEHYGDGSPGIKLFINLDDVDSLHAELTARPDPRMRPDIEVAPWHARVMQLIDPFGNRLVFNQDLDIHPQRRGAQ